MDTYEYIIIIAFIVIIYLLYKTRNIEGFATTAEIEASINSVYKTDLSAMRNLGNLANDILTKNDSLSLPAANVVAEKNMKITGNLVVDGNVTFTNKNTNSMEIFPRFMVMAWASADIPKGWAQCDGSTYKYNEDDGNVIKTVDSDSTGIKTPDLRGRFIMGAGNVTSDNRTFYNSKDYKLNEKGGEDSHTLTVDELATHDHKIDLRIGCDGNTNGGCGLPRGTHTNTLSEVGIKTSWYNVTHNWPYSTSYLSKKAQGYQGFGTGLTYEADGKNIPHNNLPPYCVLIYIMKL